MKRGARALEMPQLIGHISIQPQPALRTDREQQGSLFSNREERSRKRERIKEHDLIRGGSEKEGSTSRVRRHDLKPSRRAAPGTISRKTKGPPKGSARANVFFFYHSESGRAEDEADGEIRRGLGPLKFSSEDLRSEGNSKEGRENSCDSAWKT